MKNRILYLVCFALCPSICSTAADIHSGRRLASKAVALDGAECKLRVSGDTLSLRITRKGVDIPIYVPLAIELKSAGAIATESIVDMEAAEHPSGGLTVAFVTKREATYEYRVGMIPAVRTLKEGEPVNVTVITAFSSSKRLEVLALNSNNRHLGITMLLGDLDIEAWSEGEAAINDIVLYTNSSFSCPPLDESVGCVQLLGAR